MTDPVKTPPSVTITCNNWFHEGWLYGLLGLEPPAFNNPGNPMSDLDIESFEIGYSTARETDLIVHISSVINRMNQLGQLTVKENKQESHIL